MHDADHEAGERTCAHCGAAFTIWRLEARFFEEKGLELPKRCKVCRAHRRKAREASEPLRRGPAMCRPANW